MAPGPTEGTTDLILRLDLISMEVRRAYIWVKYNTVLCRRELDPTLRVRVKCSRRIWNGFISLMAKSPFAEGGWGDFQPCEGYSAKK